jgi:hypothetical protein
MYIRLGFCAALLLSTHTLAYASCTPEEATAKAERLANKIDAITLDDPQRAALLRQELKALSPETSAQELQDSCEVYDQRLRELDQIGNELGTPDE